MNNFIKQVIEEKFASKAQQRFFFAKANEKDKPKKEKKKWGKWAKEFSDDTDYDKIPNKVEKTEVETEVDEIIDAKGNIQRSKKSLVAAAKGITQNRTSDEVVKTGAGQMGSYGGSGSQPYRRYWGESDMSKALGYKKITHLWRELSFESCRDSVIAMARSKGYMPMWHGANGRRFESVVPEKVKLSVVFGDEDLTLPKEIAQEKSVAPAHSRWIVVDNCAHVIMWNYPALTVELIKKTALLAS